MSWKTLELDRQGPVLRVWLNRPERRNALNRLALEEIEDCFTGLQRDFSVRVVILAGRGKSFCAGADRKDPPGISAGSDRERRHSSQLGLRACRAIAALEAVTLARVHGHAVGGGFALALACDFRLACEDALFSIPEVDLGVPLSWGATPRLIHEVGAARARELILMCDVIDGRRAAEIGVVHRALPSDELDAAVDDWAGRIVAKPEIAVHMTKTQFRAYADKAELGNVTETDGDVLLAASRVGVARDSFPRSR
jgi:enoyl-CoA hydratase/carnithine racemase